MPTIKPKPTGISVPDRASVEPATRSSPTAGRLSPEALGSAAPLSKAEIEGLAKAKSVPSVPIDLDWSPALSRAELEEIETGMLEVASSIVKQNAVPDAETQLAGIIKKLEAPIAETRERLEALRENMKSQYATFSWWQRNVDNPKNYDQKQALEKRLSSWLEDASAIRGGARIGLRIRQGQKPAKAASMWQNEQKLIIDEIVASRLSPSWSKEIADLARFQVSLGNEAAAARAEASSRASDLDDYDEITWFWQRTKWLDILTLGESDKGRLYRTGSSHAKEADGIADDFESVFHTGEDRLHGAINNLLKHEDPSGYGVTRARYDLVKPAHDMLRGIERQADRVLSSLSDVESAVSHAAWVRMSEPPTTITERDQDGNWKTVNNPDHDSWEWRMRLAEQAIISAKSDASSAVSALNGMLPPFKLALEQNELRSYIGEVDSDLSTWNNWLGAFGSTMGGWAGWASWSYDHSQVDSVRADVHQLEARLAPIDAIITPKYQALHAEVWKRIGERRQELVSKGS